MRSEQRRSARTAMAPTPMLACALAVVAALGFRHAAPPIRCRSRLRQIPRPRPRSSAFWVSRTCRPPTGPNILLGQNVVPSAPGAPVAVVAPESQRIQRPPPAPLRTPHRPHPDRGVDAPDPTNWKRLRAGRLLRELYGMYQDGALKGALLGQMPLGELPVDTAPRRRREAHKDDRGCVLTTTGHRFGQPVAAADAAHQRHRSSRPAALPSHPGDHKFGDHAKRLGGSREIDLADRRGANPDPVQPCPTSLTGRDSGVAVLRS